MTPAWLHATLASGAGFAALFGAVALVSPQPRIVWNASPSMPLGLYRIHVGARPLAGDLVLIDPPEEVARLLAARAYLPHGVPLLKRVPPERLIAPMIERFMAADREFGKQRRRQGQ